jgi:phosphatidylserine decarboxylase
LHLSVYGKGTAIRTLAFIGVAAGGGLLALESPVLRIAVVVAGLTLAGFVLNFFRDPERNVPSGENIVVSPADGRIVAVKELFEGEYLRADAVQVSIFMSPLNVHVNRFPISGTVGLFRHIEGKYLVAFHEKSSEENERTVIGVEREGRRILFKQIAGAVARRIVAPVSLGQRAVCGERFGMIKFGSRVDVVVPRGSVIKVSLNERVVAGETIIASFT